MKGRGGVLIFVIIVVLLIAAFLYLRRGTSGPALFGPRQQTPAIPLDLQTLIPDGWTVQAQPQQQCDFDGDEASERLIIYRYNSTTWPDALAKAGATVDYAPFGGVIYDTQAGTLEAAPQAPGPYRASNLVPYKLLPDYYPGKGQGYLGETKVDVRYAPPITAGDKCTTKEINIYGYSNSPLPTRLSVFRWAGTEAGYQGAHFTGTAHVDASTAANGTVTRVVTYNRLLNHRSILCEVVAYTRPNLDLPTFIPDASVETIDFCFGAPGEPAYPEGVVVAMLRGTVPTTIEAPRFLLDNAIVAPEAAVLREPRHDPINIVSVGNPSTVEPVADRGAYCTTDDISTADKNALWCGRERVRVETRVMLDGKPVDLVWILISVIPNRPNADLYWRVSQVELSEVR